MQGRIIKGLGGFYDVLSDGTLYTCRARGRFRQDRQANTPMVGDWVEFTPNRGEQLGSVDRILPRKNALKRPPVANVDMLLLVTSVKNPEPDLLLLDKLTASAVAVGVDIALVINKCDLGTPDELDDLRRQYAPAVARILPVSARRGDGLDELLVCIAGQCCCLAGQSGVGKSSLINSLFPGLELQTGDTSRKTERGKHTTRHAELLNTPGGGQVADTPGFSLLEAEAMEPRLLREYYPEFQPYEGQCRFNGCLHDAEPDCAVREAAEEGAIAPERLQRYREILAEYKEKWKNRYD